MISTELLELHQAKKKSFKKGEIIFKEGNPPLNYYQIIKGDIKMCNFNDLGREFIQGLFHDGQCFGEPPLFLERTYPANAIAVSDGEIYMLSKSNFLELVNNNSQVSLSIIEHLAQRLHYKSVMAAEMSSQEPEHRLLKLIDYYIHFFKLKKEDEGFQIRLTRQQMADLIGLRVETVIRAVKALEKKKEIKLINRKIYR